MPAWGRRQSYPAVIGATLAFVAVFTATALIRPLIPDPDPNPIVARRGEFMANASKHMIKWRALEDRPFAEAKRTDRLLFIVVGSAWNWTGREIDEYIFSESELAERLNRDFIPVRVDSTFRPEWEYGPMPLLAASTGTEPGWYVLIVRPDGSPISWLSRNAAAQKIEFQTFLDMLASAQKAKSVDSPEGVRAILSQMNTEAPYLKGARKGEGGSLDDYAGSVTTKAQSPALFEEGGLYGWHPWEWRFLLARGSLGEVQSGLTKILQSSKVDWLHGGLFRTATKPDLNGIKFDKLALENAEMASVLAMVGSKTNDPFILSVARATFDSVIADFVTDENTFSFEYSEDFEQGRTPLYSLKPSLFRRRFVQGDQDWLVKKLGMDVHTNPAMTIRVVDPQDFQADRERYEGFFRRLRDILGDHPPTKGGSDLLSNIGGLSARLTEAAKTLGDTERLRKATALFPKLLAYRVGHDGVARSLKPTPDAIAYLGDFTAMADAELQNFLVTGNIDALESGRLILARAAEIFGSEGIDILRSVPIERCPPEAVWVSLPNVVDGSQGSLVGAYARLAQAYSLIYQDTRAGEALRERARTIVSQYAPLTKKVGFRLGALAHAMTHVAADRAFFVVGGDAVNIALQLGVGAGDTLIVPAVGEVRKDLQVRGKGIWLSSQGIVTGPMTLAEAKDTLAALP